MRGATQGNFVAEFAAKRAAQLERAKQLREERKKTAPETNQDRPPSGSPMTYARSYRDEDVAQQRPSRPTSASYTEESTNVTFGQRPQESSRGVPGEVVVTEDDFRRAVKQGIITPDQARQLWGVLCDPSAGARLESFKRAQPPASYDPSRYDTETNKVTDSTYRPAVGLTTKKPSVAKGKPDWNTDSSFEPSYMDEGRQPTHQAPSTAGSKRVAGASYSVRQQPAWNDNSDVNYEAPPPARTAPKKVAPKVTPSMAQRNQPAWDGGFDTERIPEEVPTMKQRQPSKLQTQPTARSVPQPQSRPTHAPPEDNYDEEEVEEFQRMKEEQNRQFEDALNEANDGAALVPCNLCGRTFRETIIDRHEIACAKANKKRKTFDMTKARLEGIDGAEEVLRSKKRMGGKNAPVTTEKPVGKIPKWKLQHQQFQAVLKINKGGAAALTGPPIPMPEELDDRVPCPHCGRKFAHETAQRHIPKCQQTINKPKSLARPIRR